MSDEFLNSMSRETAFLYGKIEPLKKELKMYEDQLAGIMRRINGEQIILGAECPRCHGCRSPWDVNNCSYCNYPDDEPKEKKETKKWNGCKS